MIARLAAFFLLTLGALPAAAESYKWVDEKGQVHYSNAPPPQVAGIAQPVEERISVMGMDPVVRAWAERRFAAEEADWEQRRQASIAMQQRSYAAPTRSASPGYGYSSPYFGYYPVSYPPGSNMAGPYLVPNSFFGRHEHRSPARPEVRPGGGHGHRGR